MATTDVVAHVAVEEAISSTCDKLNGAGVEDRDLSMYLAQLVVLLGQLSPEQSTPAPLQKLAPNLLPYLLAGTDLHVQRNAAALLTTLIGTDESTWKQLVVQDNTMVPCLVDLLKAGLQAPASQTADSSSNSDQVAQHDLPLCINMLAALTAAVQGGEEGAQSVINAGDSLHEAATDLLCQLGCYDSCKPILVDQGCVTCIAAALGATTSKEVRVRLLLGLGMLLPNNQPAQLQLAQCPAAISALMAAVKQQEDQDAQEVARSLFVGLVNNPQCKPHIEAAMRQQQAAATSA